MAISTVAFMIEIDESIGLYTWGFVAWNKPIQKFSKNGSLEVTMSGKLLHKAHGD